MKRYLVKGSNCLGLWRNIDPLALAVNHFLHFVMPTASAPLTRNPSLVFLIQGVRNWNAWNKRLIPPAKPILRYRKCISRSKRLGKICNDLDFYRYISNSISILQENEDILMATLSIFIKDPSIDWIKDSKRVKDEMLPHERVSTVKEKLGCGDPTQIITKLLRGNYKQVRLIPRLEELLSEHRIQKSNPNPDDIARCLINLASDGAILSRAYKGWKPFI